MGHACGVTDGSLPPKSVRQRGNAGMPRCLDLGPATGFQLHVTEQRQVLQLEGLSANRALVGCQKATNREECNTDAPRMSSEVSPRPGDSIAVWAWT